METYCVSCKKILQTKILVSEKIKKIDQCSYRIVLFYVSKNRGLLKLQKLVD